jgi:hypothetical protein
VFLEGCPIFVGLSSLRVASSAPRSTGVKHLVAAHRPMLP